MFTDVLTRGASPRTHVADDLQFITIQSNEDIINAREQVREMAADIGFSQVERVRFVAAVTELAQNMVRYAGSGIILLRGTRNDRTDGLTIVASDEGPGIENPNLASRDGYSTSGGLGLGLPGVRRIMDEFRITTHAGRGTTVTVTKWLR